jgi:hypothetical protein
MDMRKLIISATFSVFATMPAQAQLLESVAGGVGGAALCSGIGDGNGNIAIMAICAVAGSKIGEHYANRNRPPQQYQIMQGYPQGGYATGVPIPPEQMQPEYCDPIYYQGRYDPAGAATYCRNRQVYIWQQEQQRLNEIAWRARMGQ